MSIQESNLNKLLTYFADLKQLAEQDAAESDGLNEYFKGYAKALAHVIEKIKEEEK